MGTKNKQEILEAVSECNILRLKTDEALEFIKKETKTKISDRTYRRYKKQVQDTVNSRLEHMIKSTVQEHIQAIDLLNKVIRELWINYNASTSIKEKKSILDSLRSAQADLIACLGKSTIVDNVVRWHDDKLREIEDKKAKENSELLTTFAN